MIQENTLDTSHPQYNFYSCYIHNCFLITSKNFSHITLASVCATNWRCFFLDPNIHIKISGTACKRKWCIFLSWWANRRQRWLCCYFMLALQCSWPVIEALPSAAQQPCLSEIQRHERWLQCTLCDDLDHNYCQHGQQ